MSSDDRLQAYEERPPRVSPPVAPALDADVKTVGDGHQKNIQDLAILRNRARVSLDDAYDMFERARETAASRQKAYTVACGAYERALIGTLAPAPFVVNGPRGAAPRATAEYRTVDNLTGDKDGRGGMLNRIVALERVNKELLEYFGNPGGGFRPSLIVAMLAVRDGSPDMRPLP